MKFLWQSIIVGCFFYNYTHTYMINVTYNNLHGNKHYNTVVLTVHVGNVALKKGGIGDALYMKRTISHGQTVPFNAASSKQPMVDEKGKEVIGSIVYAPLCLHSIWVNDVLLKINKKLKNRCANLNLKIVLAPSGHFELYNITPKGDVLLSE